MARTAAAAAAAAAAGARQPRDGLAQRGERAEHAHRRLDRVARRPRQRAHAASAGPIEVRGRLQRHPVRAAEGKLLVLRLRLRLGRATLGQRVLGVQVPAG